jgi:putative membrane protein
LSNALGPAPFLLCAADICRLAVRVLDALVGCGERWGRDRAHFRRARLVRRTNSPTALLIEKVTMEKIGEDLAKLWIFGVSGLLLMYVGYFLFDKFTPRIDFAKELVENKNVAVAIMVASIIIGMAVIVASIMLPWPSPATSHP